MAIGGTPSQSFKLGADLLVQLGDLKGAAKALSEEAKIANKDVREAEREFKKLEKAKASQAELDRARGNIGSASMKAESLSQRAAELRKQDKERTANKAAIESINRNLEAEKTDRVKEAEKFQKEKTTEFQSGLNTIQKHTQSKILGIKDNIDSVANTLLNPKNGATAQAAGRALSGVADAITPGAISGVVGALGPAGAIIGGAYLTVKFAEKIADTLARPSQNIAKANQIRGETASGVFDRILSYQNKEIPQTEIDRLTRVQPEASAKARKMIEKRHLGVASGSDIGSWFGWDVNQAKMEAMFVNNALRTPAVAEQFGKRFAESVNIEKLSKTRTIEELFYQSARKKGVTNSILAKSAIGIGRVASSAGLEGDKAEAQISLLYGVENSEDEKLMIAEGVAQRTIAAQQSERANIILRANSNPVNVSERHNRATRFQALEKQRIIRQQSYASF